MRTDFYTFANWPETFAKLPLAKRPVTVVFGVQIVDTSLIFKKPCVDLEASIFNLKIVNFKKYSGPILDNSSLIYGSSKRGSDGESSKSLYE